MASLLVNHLTRDDLFLLHPDGRWRVVAPQPSKIREMIFDFTTFRNRTKFKLATCIFFTNRESDFVEVYLDEIAAAAFQSAEETERLLGLKPGVLGSTYKLLYLLISTSIVHEWLHHEIGLEEKCVGFAEEQVQNALINSNWPDQLPMGKRDMVRSHVVCPLQRSKTRLNAGGWSRPETMHKAEGLLDIGTQAPDES